MVGTVTKVLPEPVFGSSYNYEVEECNLVSLWRVVGCVVALLAAVAIVTSRYFLLIPLVYLGLWRIVLSAAFTRLYPIRHTT
jgi:uncharacterized membrane protein